MATLFGLGVFVAAFLGAAVILLSLLPKEIRDYMWNPEGDEF